MTSVIGVRKVGSASPNFPKNSLALIRWLLLVCNAIKVFSELVFFFVPTDFLLSTWVRLLEILGNGQYFNRHHGSQPTFPHVSFLTAIPISLPILLPSGGHFPTCWFLGIFWVNLSTILYPYFFPLSWNPSTRSCIPWLATPPAPGSP